MCHFVYFCINVTNAFFFFFLNVQVNPQCLFFFFFCKHGCLYSIPTVIERVDMVC